MRRPSLAVLLLALLSPTALAAADAPAPILGFSTAAAAEERAREARLDELLDPEELGAWMERLAARPHHVGSPWGKENADFMAGLFRSWGYETEIAEYQVLFPTPKVRRVELVAPVAYTATLEEPAVAEDRTSGQKDEQLPPYNAYSIDGDVTGELVYVNYGRPEDYDELARRGIDLTGKIALARYGGAWRGIKPKVAAEHGAIGCLIYSDPRDDGYFQGDVYPKGGYRPPAGVQRGSVADMPLYPGDPLTPGVGATADATRLPREEAPTLTKIPVLPLSWQDAQPLLAAMAGPLAPEDWRGALPLAYHLGPGPAKVHMTLELDWDLAPAYDVIARLPGKDLPDQWVIRGNHHDAWVNGATDPISGMVALLAEAKAVGELARAGWRPRRTIVYAAWDAEEPGLLGSVEWAEHHAAELAEKAVAYINTDSSSRGFLNAGGSHTLERMVNQAARDVVDPQKGITVLDRARAVRRLFGPPDVQKEAAAGRDVRLYPLGSGSDYTPFLQHLGIASLNLGFGGEDQYGQYHSIYDSVDHFQRFMDPGYQYGVTLAQTAGRIVLRLADAEVLPFDFAAAAEAIGSYVDEVQELADTMREETAERSKRLDDEVWEAVSDPKDPYLPPERHEPVPFLDFSPLLNARARLAASAERFATAYGPGGNTAADLPAPARAELDRILFQSERALTRADGLPGRPWYIHHVYAPGFYTGYGVKTLPGVREAIEQREWQEAEAQITVAAGVLDAFAADVDRATAILESAAPAP